MKKLMFAAAVAAGVVCGASAVESQVVGYMQMTLPAGQQYGMYAMPFDGVSGDSMTLYEIFPDPLNSFKGGVNALNADQIMFWHGGSYKSLYLFSTTATSSAAKARHGKWINPGVVPDSSWGTGNQPTALTLTGGTSFWIKRSIQGTTEAALPQKTISVSGKVITKQSGKSSYVITPATASAGAYTLCAAGFSAAFAPNPDKVDGTKAKHDWLADGCKGGVNALNSDQLMLWYNGSYKSLYLFSTTATSSAALARHGYWINPGVVPDSSWGTGNQPSTVQIQPMQGFWYFRQKGQTAALTFHTEQPYSL